MEQSRRKFMRLGGALVLEAANPMAATSKTNNRKMPTGGNSWKCVYSLDSARRRTSGSEKGLAAAIRRGADLRIYTEFRHNEHIDVTSKDSQLIQEVADFRVSYLLEDRWAAGIINLRQPISLPDGFGPRPSMSFFMYNQNGQQAIARPYLDGLPRTSRPGPSPLDDHSAMPKYHQLDGWDTETNAPSSNFIFDFERYRFYVHDEWEELLSHTPEGRVISGSVEQLAKEFSHGREVKVGIRGLCADLTAEPTRAMEHEIFVQVGSCYYYTERKQFMAASHPVVRVKPAIPIRYESKGWDFGWLMPRTDGLVARWLVDPYTLKFHKSEARYAIRWFVR
jgi:hypothetical protein